MLILLAVGWLICSLCAVNMQFVLHRDLLSSDVGNKMDVKMKPEGGGYHVPGLVTITVSSLEDVNRVISSFGKAWQCSEVTVMLCQHSLSRIFSASTMCMVFDVSLLHSLKNSNTNRVTFVSLPEMSSAFFFFSHIYKQKILSHCYKIIMSY